MFSELSLSTKNTIPGILGLSSLYIYIMLCSYKDTYKDGWIQQMLSKNSVTQGNKRRNSLCLNCAHWCQHFHSSEAALKLKSQGVSIYIARKTYSSEWKNVHLSKQVFCLRLFSSDYWRQVYLHVTAVLSFVHWTQPCTPHAGTEEDGCRCLTDLASIPLPSKAAVAINRKKLNRRCFTVQFSEAAQMLILSMSAEEALGTGPCFYWSPSSSEATKAEEESFRALTDMFSSCTRLQGRTGR